MKILRRFIGWSFFLGCLLAVGAGVFHFVRYRPRCVMEAMNAVRFLSKDGRLLVTHNMFFRTAQPKMPLEPGAVPPEDAEKNHPHRAWSWAIAATLLSGVAVLSLRHWFSKRKAARSAASVT